MSNTNKPLVLIADNDSQSASTVETRLMQSQWPARRVHQKSELLGFTGEVGIIFVDPTFAGGDAQQFIAEVAQKFPTAHLVLVTKDVEAFSNLRRAAFEFLERPVRQVRLDAILSHSSERRRLQDRVRQLEGQIIQDSITGGECPTSARPMPEVAAAVANGNGAHHRLNNGSTVSPMINLAETKKMDDIERQAILHALQQTKGNVIEAARMLGLGPATVYRKIKRYGVRAKAVAGMA